MYKRDSAANVLRYLAIVMDHEASKDWREMVDSTAATQEAVQEWLTKLQFSQRGAVLDADETEGERRRETRIMLYEAVHMVTKADAAGPSQVGGELRRLERLLIQLFARAERAATEPKAATPESVMEPIFTTLGVKDMDELMGLARTVLAPALGEIKKFLAEANKK